MKKSIKLVLAIMFLAFTNDTFSQTLEDSHTILTSHLDQVKSNMMAISSGQSKTPEERMKNASEAGKSLDFAKAEHEKMKKMVPEKHKMMTKMHHDEIDKHLGEASKHLNSLNQELSKPKPDEKMVKDDARKINELVDKAEKENQMIKKKMKETKETKEMK